MGSSIHNVRHLMSIAQCMQLPDLQYEMSLKHAPALIHPVHKHTFLLKVLQIYESDSPRCSPPGGQYISRGAGHADPLPLKDETYIHAKMASPQHPLTQGEIFLPDNYSFTEHTDIRL